MMPLRNFEAWLRHLLEQSGHPDIAKIQYFDEADFGKPAGLRVEFVDGWVIYAQIVRHAATDGEPSGEGERIIPDFTREMV